MKQLNLFPKRQWKAKRVKITATLVDTNYNFYISLHVADDLLKELMENGYKNIVQH